MKLYIIVGMMAIFWPSMNGQRVYSATSSIQLNPTVSRTILRLPALPSPDALVRANFIVNAPEGFRVLLKCENGNEVVECTEGVLRIVNGLPEKSCRKNLETEKTTVTLSMINVHQVSDQTVCEAYVLTGQTEEKCQQNLQNDDDFESGTRNTTCPCGWRNVKRIVGGTVASSNEYPLIAALVNKQTGGRFCGGAIITDSLILTAAHCLDDLSASDIKVVVGDHDMRGGIRTGYEQTINARRLVSHQNWDTKKLVNDIGIVQLERSINFNQNVGPVCLPSSRTNLVGKTITAMGWGLTKTTNERDRGMLRKVDLKVVDLPACALSYGNTINTRTPTQLCTFARNKDTCQGDSGGPLVWLDPETNRLTQIALVSFGKECGSSSPAVNTDVAAYMPWINSIIGRLTPGQAACTKV